MKKIQMIANRETNFVYHMLSVARCGYDNAYGAKYRDYYPAELLEILKKHEALITCEGGKYWGALYTMLVSVPATGHKTAKEYYQGIISDIDSGELAECYKDYSLIEPALEISKVMVQCYDCYVEKVWPEDKRLIEAYIAETMPLFENSDFTERAEEVVGCKLPTDFFYATMVASIDGGAEAIDISEDQDVFGIERSPEWAFRFIGHEFIVYLLKEKLKDEDAFKGIETWEYTEGLAEEYFNKI